MVLCSAWNTEATLAVHLPGAHVPRPQMPLRPQAAGVPVPEPAAPNSPSEGLPATGSPAEHSCSPRRSHRTGAAPRFPLTHGAAASHPGSHPRASRPAVCSSCTASPARPLPAPLCSLNDRSCPDRLLITRASRQPAGESKDEHVAPHTGTKFPRAHAVAFGHAPLARVTACAFGSGECAPAALRPCLGRGLRSQRRSWRIPGRLEGPQAGLPAPEISMARGLLFRPGLWPHSPGSGNAAPPALLPLVSQGLTLPSRERRGVGRGLPTGSWL